MGIFSERLRDLSRWRAKRALGKKVAKKICRLGDSRLEEMDRAEKRAQHFLAFLRLTSFESLQELTDTWTRHKGSFPSPKP